MLGPFVPYFGAAGWEAPGVSFEPLPFGSALGSGVLVGATPSFADLSPQPITANPEMTSDTNPKSRTAFFILIYKVGLQHYHRNPLTLPASVRSLVVAVRRNVVRAEQPWEAAVSPEGITRHSGRAVV